MFQNIIRCSKFIICDKIFTQSFVYFGRLRLRFRPTSYISLIMGGGGGGKVTSKPDIRYGEERASWRWECSLN